MATNTPGLQQRSQYHGYWGVFADATTGLPNQAGNPLAANQFKLEQGDTAYHDGAGVGPQGLYVCDDPGTVGGGDAVWSLVGPGGSQTQDHQAPRAIVGNALEGDTLFVCDFLDPGDGTGIQAALAALPANGGDVWVRPGTYDLGQGGVCPLVIPNNSRVWGAGKSTVLVGDPIQRTMFSMTPFANLSQLQIQMPDAVVGATGAYVVALASLVGIDDVTLTFQGIVSTPEESLIGAIGDLASAGVQIRNCLIGGVLGQVGPFACIDIASQLNQLVNNICFGGDFALRLGGSDITVTNQVVSSSTGGAFVSGGRQRVELVGRVNGGRVFDCVGLIFSSVSGQVDNIQAPGGTIGINIDSACEAVNVTNCTVFGFGTAVNVEAGAADTIVGLSHFENNAVDIADAGTTSEIAHNVVSP